MGRTTIGIRREDKNRWEARAPLTPTAVERLVDERGLGVRIQPSSIRAFPDEAYGRVGAEVAEELSGCDLVLAVKEIPAELLREGGTYAFFSHTIKGQPYNRALLRRLVELGCTLIDYERIADQDGRRLIFFGRHAGLAGMIDTLWALGQRLRSLGQPTALSELELTHRYGSLAEAEAAVSSVGERIRAEGLPARLAPLVVGISGYGNVSQGAQHILDRLPVEQLGPAELAELGARSSPPRDRLFKVVFSEEHMVEPTRPGAAFALQDYYDHPERYRGIFERHLPWLTVLVNAIYWTEAYPRLLTLDYLGRAFVGPERPRLQVIGDLSCDIEGAVECTTKATMPDRPVFVYDPSTSRSVDGFEGPGVVVMAVDNLPCELSQEASESFSEALLPLVVDMARADYTQPFERIALPDSVKRALILLRGKLTPDYQYMTAFLD